MQSCIANKGPSVCTRCDCSSALGRIILYTDELLERTYVLSYAIVSYCKRRKPFRRGEHGLYVVYLCHSFLLMPFVALLITSYAHYDFYVCAQGRLRNIPSHFYCANVCVMRLMHITVGMCTLIVY